MPQNRKFKKLIFAIAMMLFLILAAQAFGQYGNAQLLGSVKDAESALLPGVVVTATDMDTQIAVKTLTNVHGNYFFGNLQTGTYKLTVETSGFRTITMENVTIAIRDGVIIDVVMKDQDDNSMIVKVVASVPPPATPAIIVKEENLDIQSNPTIPRLPSTSNNVIDLITMLNGITPPIDRLLYPNTQMLGGTMASDVNVLRDGIYVKYVRRNFGIQTPSRINSELVKDLKVSLSPADVEYGWGVEQVQIATKTGRKAYNGSVIYNVQNDALNSQNWNQNNFSNNWSNLHNYIATFSGPIIREKTLIFASWDHTLANNRSDVTPIVLTACARKGILRYFSGWDNRNAVSSTSTSTAIPYRAVVNSAGVPLAAGLVPDSQAITLQPDGTTASGLQLQSVFGRLNSNAQSLLAQDPVNCSKYDPYNDLGVAAFWETNMSGRGFRGLDTLTVPRFSNKMPLPNNYSMMNNAYSNNGGDGLNTAVMKWTRKNEGSGTEYAGGTQNNRKNININVQHNLNNRHRISGNFMIELTGGVDASRLWPDVGYEGTFDRRPQQYGFTVNSTLKSTMFNEARIGLARMVSHGDSPMNAPENGNKVKDLLRYLVPTDSFPDYTNLPLIAGLGAERDASDVAQTSPPTIVFSPEGSGMTYGNFGNPSSHPYGTKNSSLIGTFGSTDHRWTISDAFTLIQGPHTFKFGGDIRLMKSLQDTDGNISSANTALTYPMAFGGFTDYSIPQWTYPADIGLVGTRSYLLKSGGGVTNNSTGTLAGMIDLLTYMSGSISNIRQQYFAKNTFDRKWNDAIGKGETFQTTDMRQKEFAFFVKDDWRVNPDLTLKLGVRWEYYGTPWLNNGTMVGLQGGSSALFGVTGRDIGSWMSANPVNLGDDYLTRELFIGPNSPNPHQSLYRKDYNNFGPAVGFLYRLRGLGKRGTIIRGGYQMSYRAIGNVSARGETDSIAAVTGMIYTHYYRGSTDLPYLSVDNLDSAVPTSKHMDPAIVPLDALKIRNHGVSFAAYDHDVRNPYSQSLNLSVTHDITNTIVLDVRYTGTLARKGIGSIDLNTPNYIGNGLLAALNEARKGNNPVLFDRMFNGIQFGQIGNSLAVGATGAYTGADIIRRKWSSSLANGDYASIATSLANLNYDKTVVTDIGMSRVNESLPDIPPGEQGAVLRLANTNYPGIFPENYILANPQLSNAELRGNLIHSNYHSMQVQVTIRPNQGISLASAYTLAKNLADQPGSGFWGGGSWTDPMNRSMDYKPSYTRKHQWNTYGYMDLPFGSDGYFFRNVKKGLIKQAIEGWQLSWSLRLQSGSPQQITGGANHLYSSATYLDLVGLKDLAPGKSNLSWAPGSYYGNYYGSGANPRYSIGPDPQCSNQALLGGLTNYGWGQDGNTPLSSLCTLQALYFNNSNGARTLVLQQPLPGHQGTFSNSMEGVGSFSLDAAIGKNIQLDQEKSFNFRMDFSNILNHPSPGDPAFTLSQYADFGSVANKTGNRIVQAKITLRF
jgi:hypothetical protein